jgi:hypothetical protein
MTYFNVRSTDAVCDKPVSGQPVHLARFHTKIFRIKISVVASVTQETLGIVSCSPCRPQGTWQTYRCLQSTLNCEARQWIQILHFWELLRVSSTWILSVLKYDVKTHLELRLKSESSAYCCLVKCSAFWFGRRIIRSGGQCYRQLRVRKVPLALKKLKLWKKWSTAA